MVAFDASNAHFDYLDVTRHWSPLSEHYAGGDALITLLSNGWEISETVFYEEVWHAGSRLVLVYHMDLARDDQLMRVPVLGNPYVRRLVASLPLQIRPNDNSRQRA